jgi:hypothetical protein
MAGGVTQYVLKGGPCAGNTGTLTPADDQTGEIVCKNHVYKRGNPAVVQGGREVFTDSGVVPPPKKSDNAPKTHKGWNDLRHSLNHNMPAALRSADRSTGAALRNLSRGRKVHG